MYKKKVAKGPNPLAVKKRDRTDEDHTEGKKKRRKRKGVRRKVKAEQKENEENG